MFSFGLRPEVEMGRKKGTATGMGTRKEGAGIWEDHDRKQEGNREAKQGANTHEEEYTPLEKGTWVETEMEPPRAPQISQRLQNPSNASTTTKPK